MKKLVLMVLVMAVALLGIAGAEQAQDAAGWLSGRSFEFSSGVGAWATEITFAEDGAFTGVFHDSEMGEDGEGYPNGTVYICRFHGQLSGAEQVDSVTWRLTVTALEAEEAVDAETIEDGIRYVTAEPYGLAEGDTILLMMAGTPVEGQPEDFYFWTHLMETDPEAAVLPWAVLWNETESTGFVETPAAE